MSSRVRVATFNIRNGLAFDGWNSWPLRKWATARAILALDADVVALQEVYAFQLRWLLRRCRDYEATGTGRFGAGRGEHCPVLVRRTRVRVVEQATRWYGEDPDHAGRLPGASFPRIATTCRVAMVDGPEVQVTNTHLDERIAAHRVTSVTQLVTWLDSTRPHIVTGDFNAEPDDEVFAPLLAAGLRPVIPAGAGGTAHNFTGRHDGRRIDHILVSEHIGVAEAHIAHDRTRCHLPSDHWPVVADLEL